mgnify:CR=1 FL=1
MLGLFFSNSFFYLCRKNNEINNRNLSAKMIVQVHDELVFDCPNDELEELKNSKSVFIKIKITI